ncbi:MAG: hypothetical protein HRT70_07985 [Flavobacteriaceae bacterium]|nr:hypothetical protein [Flavobacteriaceae bacterium]
MEVEAQNKGLTMEEVCTEAKVPKANFFQWKNGISYPSGYWMKKLHSTFLCMLANYGG